jgi:hypothetical protein
MRALRAALAVIGIGLPGLGAADDGEPPIMDSNRPVQCAKDKEGQVWRLQCDHAAKVCLYAPDAELDVEGERRKSLERTRDCALDPPFDRPGLEARGYKMRAGRADAPFGWTRDARGRVFQVNFDLKRRMYFGAAYSPRKILENPFQSTRTSIDYGLFVFETRTPGKSPMRHRIRLLEGEVHLEPFTAEMIVAHYDMSRRFLDPLVRITTFAGTPRRHDLHPLADLGVTSVDMPATPQSLWRLMQERRQPIAAE